MKSNSKTWIYCRVNNKSSYSLLNKQKRLLKYYAVQHNLYVVGISKESSSGSTLNTFTLNNLTAAIKRKEVNFVLIYCSSRICIHQQLFVEFELFCHTRNVCTVSIKDYINDAII